jgi:Tfp pilus assembly protein PilF
MNNSETSCEVEQRESRTNSLLTREVTIGNVAETVTLQRWSDARRPLVRQAALCALVLLVVLVTPLCAQNVALFSSSEGSHAPSVPLFGVLGHLPMPQVIEDETCLPWAVSAVLGATVSVNRLQVPSDARNEFEKACGDMKKRKLSDAAQHARNATAKYPHYAAAWVMLGKALEELAQTEEAREACSRALSTDPTYLPPYLCLAEISVRDQQWDAVLNVTDVVIGLNRAGDAYVYFFRAMAFYQLQRISEAEKSALDAASIDTDRNVEASVRFLLAQIYEAEGQLDLATAQLRHFMKLSTDRHEVTVAKEYLVRLEANKP